MNTKLNLEDKVNGKYKSKTIREIINLDKKYIFELIKQGYYFDDEVLNMAGIKKNVRNETIKLEIASHEKDNKVYDKETESVKQILKSLLTIDNQITEGNEEFQNEDNGDDEE